jgi:SPP1 family predicted phage head-tail adaptor
MRAGRLRHLVTLASAPAFASAGTAYAAIEPQVIRPDTEAEGLKGELPFDIWLRYNPSVLVRAGWRIIFGSRLFEVVTEPLNKDERNQTLQLNCREYVGEAVTIGEESGIAYIFRDVTDVEFADGWHTSTEPHTEIELLQSQWSAKPEYGTEITITATSEVFALEKIVKSDGVIWRYIVRAL